MKAEKCLKLPEGINRPAEKDEIEKAMITGWGGAWKKKGKLFPLSYSLAKLMARLGAKQQVRQWQWQRAAAGEDADSVAGAAGVTVTRSQPDKALVSVMCPMALRCLWSLSLPECAFANVSTCWQVLILCWLSYVSLFTSLWCLVHHLFLPSLLFLVFLSS